MRKLIPRKLFYNGLSAKVYTLKIYPLYTVCTCMYRHSGAKLQGGSVAGLDPGESETHCTTHHHTALYMHSQISPHQSCIKQ